MLRNSRKLNQERGYGSEYERWVEEIEKPGDELRSLPTLLFPSFAVSVVVVVSESDLDQVGASIDSVVAQTWTDWKLYLLGTNRAAATLSVRYADEPRISVLDSGDAGGLSVSALAARLPADGYSCFLRAGDRLDCWTLADAVTELQDDPAADLIYADHDFVDTGGERSDPVFKPDWSPDLLLSTNYISDALAARNRLLTELGPLEIGHSPETGYTFLLRLTAKRLKTKHIDRVLYHKIRRPEGQSAGCSSRIRQAIQEHCDELGDHVVVETGIAPHTWRVRYPIAAPVPVSIVIASGGRLDVLKENIASLKSTSYSHFEVVVIDNSSAGEVADCIETLRESNSAPIRYLDWRRKPFNYSEMNNMAARQCSSPLLLFLNDDTTVIGADWLASMVELAIRPEVGAVGAKLLYPDGTIQHAGIAVGIQGTAAHTFRRMDNDGGHYGNYPDVIRNVSAVTGACLMTRAEIFWEMGGFDADKLPVDFNDVDLCLKIGARGYRVLYTPFAVLYHHESLSRRSGPRQPDLLQVSEIRSRWRPLVVRDPFYNRNLTRDDVDYSLRSLRLRESTEHPAH